ncbi:hypothetical protein DITRI_Ditri03aG0188300 [Diplodiscus trichospermus]
MKKARRIISIDLNPISIVTIALIILLHLTQVAASRHLWHPLSPNSVATIKVAQAYSGPSRGGVGHSTIG